MNKQQSAKARERRLRKKYAKKMRFGIIVALVIGLAGGFAAGRYTAKLTDRQPRAQVEPTPLVPSLEATPEATEAAPTEPAVTPQAAEATVTPAPTEVPAPTATPAPSEIIVPYGQEQTVTAQIYADGTVRKANDARAYETVNFSIRITRYLSEKYYKETWSNDYDLRGNESSVEFEIMLKDYMGTQKIAPQDVLDFSYELLNGDTEPGYQLTTAELQGLEKAELETNIPRTLYKRFDYNPAAGDMKYLVVKAYVDGVETKYFFEVGDPIRPTPAPTAEPTPAPTQEPLTVGSKGDQVRLVQDALVRLGYLTDTADGTFGERTARAVKKAQKAFDMEQTGIADDAFQTRLFEEVKGK
ncbi:MAG: peptidoglycan-binding protein [Candidatus Faecivicinus sp.]|nr:peptidoglycan-binding protein [Candidatus Faecivicinus sp.]